MNDFMHEWTDEQIIKIGEEVKQLFQASYEKIEKDVDKFTKKVKYKEDLEGYLKLKAWNKHENLAKLVMAVTLEIQSLNKATLNVINKNLPQIFEKNYNFGLFIASQITQENFIEGIITEIIAKEKLEALRNEFTEVKYEEITNLGFLSATIKKNIKDGILVEKEQISANLYKLLNKYLNTALVTIMVNSTTSENGGRLESFKYADERYSGLKKRWISTLDSKTRPSHRRLNLSIAPVDGKFKNGLKYPGEPGKNPKETLNCRCTITVFNPRYDEEFNKNILKEINRKAYRIWKDGEGGNNNARNKAR